MLLQPEEPSAGPWRTVPLAHLLEGVPGARVVAVDGRGGSGKSTLAAALADQIPGVVVVHTDDLAWHEPLFAWGHLLEAVLTGVRAGDDVRFVPPQWIARGREGAVRVPAGTPLVVVEGTGAAQRRVAGLLDAVVWVQSDDLEAERLGLLRDVAEGRTPAEAKTFWDRWMGAERPFFAADRPWARADLVVAGNGVGPARAAGLLAVAAGPLGPGLSGSRFQSLRAR